MSGSTKSDRPAVEQRVESILRELTIREKVALLSGLDSWQTVPIERLGIPSLVMTDGPHGVRANRTGPERVQGPATSFPTGVSMASTWNPDLIHRVGVALAEETRAMGCDILLGPCVNIVRTPLAGRNFESYTEDPYLAGRLAVAYIQGVQSRGVGTSLKHYACNNQEYERFRGSSELDERTLREIYLPAFEAAVQEAQPWTVMCSYNRINGVYASENHHLLNEILRQEWGFEGAVVSDWGANHTTVASVQGGLDLEMPGPARWYGRLLVDAVRIWQIEEEVIDEAVRRILRLIVRSGRLDDPAAIPAGSVNTPEHQALARQVAEESIVLLKNETNILPLDPTALHSIAVIGPNADEARIGGGGSSYLEPPYSVSPLAGLRARLGDTVQLTYEQGCSNDVEPPVLKPEYVTPANGTGSGLWGEYYANTDLSGEPAAARVEDKLDHWRLTPPQGVPENEFSARWSGQLTVPTAGRHIFRLVTSGTARLYLDGRQIAQTQPDPKAVAERPVTTAEAVVDLKAGRGYDLRVEYVKTAAVEGRMLYLRFAYTPEPDERLQRAVELARRSDVVVIFAGMPTGFESEGRDRPDMKLPGRQDELIAAVAAANPRTIVVLNAGSPVEMPWVDRVPAIVLAYYPGQEAGHALANILLGEINPSGKLTATWPRHYRDNPSSTNYPGGRTVHYGERIYVGYRYYDYKEIEPLFPFGHGLSYTGFAYRDLQVPAAAQIGEPVTVSLTVENTGQRAGQEVVQLYVRDVAASVDRPLKELKGFHKAALKPGESKRIQFSLDRRAFAFYDPLSAGWIVEPGEFEILVGASSRDIRAQGTITLNE